MINFRNSPFLWFSLTLLLAVRAHDWIAAFNPIFINGLVVVCLVLGGLSLISYAPQKRWYSTLAILLLIFFSGLWRTDRFSKDIYSKSSFVEPVFMEGIVHVQQVLKAKDNQVTLKCQTVALKSPVDSLQNIFEDKFLLVHVKTVFPLTFLPGDQVGLYGCVSLIKPPMNSHVFDARVYYNTIGIRHVMYVKAEDISLDFPNRFSLMRMTAQWQGFLSSIVRKHTRPEVAQLTNALVWGDRSDMNEDVRDAFAGSGAMHVLSVSGMHVAIVYGFLIWILGAPGNGGLMQRMIRFALYGAGIMLYVGLAGGCAAVMRAGLMILLFLFGKCMGWHTQIWNLLGFAAFMMFWINPFIGDNIGFQLSFLAMAGILLFAKPLIRTIAFKNRILHIIWEITALSLAAQVFILPVLLSQFHQFPLTFIISSIVAMPASYIVMGSALINVILSLINIDILWPVLDYSGYYFIVVMKWMAGLNPLMHYSLPSLAATCLMFMAIAFSLSLVFKWRWGKRLAYVCAIIVAVSAGCHRTTMWSDKEIMIYHSPRGMLIDIFEKGNCYSIHDDRVSESSIEFTTRGYRCHKDIIQTTSFLTGQEFSKTGLSFDDEILKVHNQNMYFYTFSSGKRSGEIPDTILIHSWKDFRSVADFICQNATATFIIPAHHSLKQSRIIRKMLDDVGAKYYDIGERGFLKITL